MLRQVNTNDELVFTVSGTVAPVEIAGRVKAYETLTGVKASAYITGVFDTPAGQYRQKKLALIVGCSDSRINFDSATDGVISVNPAGIHTLVIAPEGYYG